MTNKQVALIIALVYTYFTSQAVDRDRVINNANFFWTWLF